MKAGTEAVLMTVGYVAVYVVVFSLIWVGCSAMESRTFNRLTGAETTTVDAMFCQLRVSEPFRGSDD